MQNAKALCSCVVAFLHCCIRAFSGIGASWHWCAVAFVAVLTASACRQDMHDQPKYSALEASSFFSDNASARPPVAGTVARGELRDDVDGAVADAHDEHALALEIQWRARVDVVV